MRTEYVSEEIIALQKVLDQKCYWWVLINNVFLCTHIKGERMDIKLPLPVIQNCQERRRWDFKYMKRKEHDDEEIARCKAIWSGLVEAIQERVQRINAGESTVEEEFKAGILFEDGKYGLKYKESDTVNLAGYTDYCVCFYDSSEQKVCFYDEIEDRYIRRQKVKDKTEADTIIQAWVDNAPVGVICQRL